MPTAPVRLSEMKEAHWRILLYGGSGVGKTILALSSQTLSAFVFDVDRSLHSAWAWRGSSDSPTPGCKTDRIHVWPTLSFADLMSGMRYLDAHRRDYQLVVLDSGSEVQRMVVGEICKLTNHVIADQQDWGKILNYMLDLVRWFRGLDCHVIWTAHERTRLDLDLGRYVWAPAFQGQFQGECIKHFAEVWRYIVWDQQVPDGAQQLRTVTHRALKCWRDPVTEAKDRSNALAQFEQPNLDALIAKMDASLQRV